MDTFSLCNPSALILVIIVLKLHGLARAGHKALAHENMPQDSFFKEQLHTLLLWLEVQMSHKCAKFFHSSSKIKKESDTTCAVCQGLFYRRG